MAIRESDNINTHAPMRTRTKLFLTVLSDREKADRNIPEIAIAYKITGMVYSFSLGPIPMNRETR